MQLVWRALGALLLSGFGAAQMFIAINGVWQTVERVSLWVRGHRATGVVVSVGEEKDPDSKPQYRLTVEFTTADGERRVADLADAMDNRRDVGARVAVLYRPHDPDHVVAAGVGKAVLSVVTFPILMVVGAIFFGLAVVYLLDIDRVTLWNGRVFEFDY